MKSSGIQAKSTTFYNYREILVILFIILLVTFLWKVWKIRRSFPIISVPYVPLYDSAFLEFAYMVLVSMTGRRTLTSVLFQVLNTMAKRFEKEGIFQIWVFRRIVFIFNEETVKTLATNEACADKSADYNLLKEVLGDGLITSNGELWKSDRKKFNPIFYTGILKEKIHVLNKNSKLLVKSLEEIVERNVLDLHPSISTYAFDNVFESILGINYKESETEVNIPELQKQIEKLAEYINRRCLFSSVIAKFIKFCTPSGWSYLKLYNKTMQLYYKTIPRLVESQACNSKLSKSLFHILVKNSLNDSSLTSDYIKDHVYTFLAAGTHTMVSTMIWLLFLLGHHKDVQEKAFEEIQSITDEMVTFEDICRLEYLECIIKETLRLYPVPIIARSLNKDIQCGKYTVPKDTTVAFFLYRLHRNSEIYPNPEMFDPERFRSGNAEKRKWAHIPFSEGYRNCIGKKFAMMEIKMALVYILRNYEIVSLDKREDVDLDWKVTLMPSKPLNMRLKPRNVLSNSS